MAFNVTTLTKTNGDTFTNIVGTTVSAPFITETATQKTDSFVFHAIYNVVTPDDEGFSSTDVDTSADTIALDASQFVTGLAVTLTTTGVLPTGLAAATTYYVIKVSASSIKLATTLANALNSTAINITAAGSGDSDVVVTALTSCSLTLRGSNDGTNFFAIPEVTATTITADGTTTYEVDYVRFPFYEARVAITAGYVDFSLIQIGAKAGD